jgi:isopenicillin N synthase-like dioxygenase
MVLDSTEPLIGTPTLDYESVGLNFYDSDRLSPDRVHFNPAHKDSGTLTILVRSNESCDGLEIADLQSTERLDSENIGQEASFISVPAVAGEVIVLAGTRLQRLLGKSKVRACVHRVCRPLQASDKQQRLSLAIFCGPTMK